MNALSLANVGGFWPKESWTDQPGCYIALGQPAAVDTKWIRVYWNLNPCGAVTLTGAATTLLNRCNIPFRLKILLDTSVGRRDRAVLYVPPNYWPSARSVIEAVAGRLEECGDLHSSTPLFTKALRPGVAFAEDPRTGISFGMHRSWLVARSIARSYLDNHNTESEQWDDLAAEFTREGLSIERPYLNAGSRDIYEL